MTAKTAVPGIETVSQGGSYGPPTDPRSHPQYHQSRGFTLLLGGARKRGVAATC